MKKLIFLSFAIFALLSCGQKSAPEASNQTELTNAEVTVYYFHGPQRCKSCLAIEDAARKAVAENFTDTSKVQFVEVELADKRYSELIEKYEIAWSSLVIEKGILYTNMTEKGFSMALSDPEGLKKAVIDEITRYLED